MTSVDVDEALTLSGVPQDVAVARAFARRLLEARTYERCRDDVVLAVSELVTNAIVHAGGTVGLHLVAGTRSVRVEVSDESPTSPEPTEGRDVGGRGLPIVAMVASGWGVQSRSGDGKIVWCTVDVA